MCEYSGNDSEIIQQIEYLQSTKRTIEPFCSSGDLHFNRASKTLLSIYIIKAWNIGGSLCRDHAAHQ